ncbi:helix-turn-helix domain-containing protein [Catellatospora coxensis]|uniref:Putative regulatory protein, ArsR family n=2 Tax=Catellatospora coxensis TaxID=310354 RepID=A0A8J3KUT0_9ACTN|nr:putative regulatory protein, ArsR family [Catellatospora coxensis]
MSLVGRARVHAALGEPARLAIVDALLLGDASPGELGRQLDMTTNLLAHHLNVLSGAGLVDRVRSEGDRRRTYLRLRRGTLDLLTPAAPGPARRVLFVCTHNSARSQLAAALWARCSAIPAASAGTMPATGVHPKAIAAAARHGLDLAGAGTADVRDVLRDDDLVVAVCDIAHEQLREPTRRLHWSVPDPAVSDTDEAFEAAFGDLAARVDRLAPALPAGRR